MFLSVSGNHSHPTKHPHSKEDLSNLSYSYVGPSPQSNVPSVRYEYRTKSNCELNHNYPWERHEKILKEQKWLQTIHFAFATGSLYQRFLVQQRDKSDPHKRTQYHHLMTRAWGTCLFNTTSALFKIFHCTKFKLRVR